ncbi:MAG: hypothetical protein QM796_01650 [Chthoniobacteraceae bacterium]
MDAAYDFLLRVRTELHYLNKRPTDVLTLAYQFKVANKFNYPQKDILRRAETFMRDYYSHARNIFQITELVAGRMSLETPASASGLRRLLPKARSKKVSFDGFHSLDGLIYPDSREIFREDPYRLMRVFQHAQMRGLGLSPELEQAHPAPRAAGRSHFPILPHRPRDLHGDSLPQGTGGTHPAAHARDGFSRALHPRVRRAHLPGAA